MDEEQAAHEGRRRLYAVLGTAFYRQPSGPFLEALASADLQSAVSIPVNCREAREGLELLASSLEPFRQGADDKDVAALEFDYFQMFIGAGMPKVPPWESYYRTEERLLFSCHTLEVRAWYDRFGLASDRKGAEPEDHIGLELEFMAHLCHRSNQCRLRGEAVEARSAAGAQREFLAGHLLEWAPGFCREVSRSAGTPFFVGLARLTEGFLLWDHRFLDASGG